MQRTFTLFAGLAIWGILIGSAAAQPSADELIAKWSAALGGRDRLAQIATVYSKYKVSVAGMEGTAESWVTREGASRQNFVLGEIYSALTVFDGKSGWILDHNGKVQALQGADLTNQITEAYFSSFSHLIGGRMPGRVESLGPDSAGTCYRLSITPDGGKAVTVFLDAKTFLPVRQERPMDDRTEVTYVEDWRPVQGLLWPHSVRVTTGDAQYDTRLEALEIRTDIEPPPHAFEQPQEGAKDYRFASGESAVGIPIELNSNHVYVKAQVNGGEALWFIFDTGAGATVLDRARAEALGLPLQGQLEGRGAGEKSVAVAMIPKASFTLPGAELVDQTIMAIPLGMISPYEGRPVDGILGFDLISRFVVKIDYAAKRLDLFEPASYQYSGSGERIPITMEDNHPHVSADLKVGERLVKGYFLIDTGARTALDLNRPFCEEHQLVDAVRTIEGGFAAGVGGETRQRIGRTAELKLGKVVLNDVITGFSQDQKGAMASRDASGIIGGDVLRRFTVIFDYSRNEMILEPNANVSLPFEYDMSGAFLRSADLLSGIEIRRVVEGSPAAEAGLREGDRITAIDGRSASEYTLEAVRALFLKPGLTLRIAYLRDGAAAETSLTTKRLI
jgi:hypothetical protein